MKYRCKDVAFLLIGRFDSIDRLENAIMVTDYLTSNLTTNIYFWEFSAFNNGIFQRLAPQSVNYIFCQDKNPILHRTRHLNTMILRTKEKFVSIWDIDVLAPIPQVIESVRLLRNGAGFVYPYESHFYDTTMELRSHFYMNRDINYLLQNVSFMPELYAPKPVGGCFFANRQTYINSGMEKEEFYGWGIEDGERFSRWYIQKQKVERVQGPLFHLSHARGINSKMPSAESRLIKHRIYNSSLKTESWRNT